MCRQCSRERVNRPETLIPTAFPERPWQKVASDLFELNKQMYIIVVDYYSRFFEVAKLSQTSAKHVIEKLKQIFACHGSPEYFYSDNGPPYINQEFKDFAKSWGFTHIKSSPRFPQSNGEAERTVQTVKSILKKRSDPWQGIQTYRASVLENGFTPSELLFSRQIRTSLLTLPSKLNPKCVNPETLRKKEVEYRNRQARNFDKRHKAKELSPLHTGDQVWIKDYGEGIVQQKADTPRSYQVETPDGGIQRRNRRHLVQTEVEDSVEENANIATEDEEELDFGQEEPVSKESASDIQYQERPRRLPVHLKDYVVTGLKK